MSRLVRTVLAVTLLVACREADTTAPTRPNSARPITASATKVYPAAQYAVTALLSDHGWFMDVSDRNLVVGTLYTYAVAMPLGGGVHTLPPGTSSESNANAVNSRGSIVGRANLGTVASPRWTPTLWPDMTSAPVFAGIAGEAADINDQGLIVGTSTPKGRPTFAFVWDGSTPPVALRPLYRGGWSRAVAINNDRIILGESETPNGSTTVVWRQGTSGWTPVQVNGGIMGKDIDAAMGIVGQTGNGASFGDPDHAGFFNTGAGEANAVSSRGIATGTDAAGSPGWPTYWVAFVGDRAGNTTHLPDPPAFIRATQGFGINTCGVVVGSVWVLGGFHTTNPVVWDPGC